MILWYIYHLVSRRCPWGSFRLGNCSYIFRVCTKFVGNNQNWKYMQNCWRLYIVAPCRRGFLNSACSMIWFLPTYLERFSHNFYWNCKALKFISVNHYCTYTYLEFPTSAAEIENFTLSMLDDNKRRTIICVYIINFLSFVHLPKKIISLDLISLNGCKILKKVQYIFKY